MVEAGPSSGDKVKQKVVLQSQVAPTFCLSAVGGSGLATAPEVVVISDEENDEPPSKRPCSDSAGKTEPVVAASDSIADIPLDHQVRIIRNTLARVGVAAPEGGSMNLMIGVLFAAMRR